MRHNPGRPNPDEHHPYYALYVNRVPDGDVVAQLERQLDSTLALIGPLTPAQAVFRPKPDDWHVTQVIGHLADSERVFSYRALRFARNDPTPLPGIDQDVLMAGSLFDRRPLADVLAEFAADRRATIALFASLDPEAWLRRGSADGNPVSVRALAYITAGHELHHIADFHARYGI